MAEKITVTLSLAASDQDTSPLENAPNRPWPNVTIDYVIPKVTKPSKRNAELTFEFSDVPAELTELTATAFAFQQVDTEWWKVADTSSNGNEFYVKSTDPLTIRDKNDVALDYVYLLLVSGKKNGQPYTFAIDPTIHNDGGA